MADIVSEEESGKSRKSRRLRFFRRISGRASLQSATDEVRIPELPVEVQLTLLTFFSFVALVTTGLLHLVPSASRFVHEKLWGRFPEAPAVETRLFVLIQLIITVVAWLLASDLLRNIVGIVLATLEVQWQHLKKWVEGPSGVADEAKPVPVPAPVQGKEVPGADSSAFRDSYYRILVWILAVSDLLSLSYLVCVTGGTSASPYMPALMLYCSLAPFCINNPRVITILMVAVPVYLISLAAYVWLYVNPPDVRAADGMVPLVVTAGTAFISFFLSWLFKNAAEKNRKKDSGRARVSDGNG